MVIVNGTWMVDPRLRGGDFRLGVGRLVHSGGSPLTRGRPGWRSTTDEDDGWIPAYAGETLHYNGAVAFQDVVLESRVHGYDSESPTLVQVGNGPQVVNLGRVVREPAPYTSCREQSPTALALGEL